MVACIPLFHFVLARSDAPPPQHTLPHVLVTRCRRSSLCSLAFAWAVCRGAYTTYVMNIETTAFSPACALPTMRYDRVVASIPSVGYSDENASSTILANWRDCNERIQQTCKQVQRHRRDGDHAGGGFLPR